MAMWRVMAVAGALAALGACSDSGSDGGGSGPGEPVVPVEPSLRDVALERTERLIGLEEDVANGSNTAFDSMPTSGSASFEGVAAILIGDPVDVQGALVGEATMTADFGDGTITGRADEFVGAIDDGGFEEFDGALTMTNGRIGEDRPNSVSTTLEGDLTSDNHSVSVSTDMDGSFYGNPNQGIVLGSTGALLAVDGAPTIGAIEVIVARD